MPRETVDYIVLGFWMRGNIRYFLWSSDSYDFEKIREIESLETSFAEFVELLGDKIPEDDELEDWRGTAEKCVQALLDYIAENNYNWPESPSPSPDPSTETTTLETIIEETIENKGE